MAEKTQKKVVAKKLIGFDKDMLDALNKHIKGGVGKDETDVLRKLLLGEQKFTPAIEAYLREQQEATAYSRPELVQILILEALQLKDERFRLSGTVPRQK